MSDCCCNADSAQKHKWNFMPTLLEPVARLHSSVDTAVFMKPYVQWEMRLKDGAQPSANVKSYDCSQSTAQRIESCTSQEALRFSLRHGVPVRRLKVQVVPTWRAKAVRMTDSRGEFSVCSTRELSEERCGDAE